MSENKKLSRRDFLKVVGLAGGSAATIAASAPNSQPAFGVPAFVGKPFDGKTLRMHAISGANYDELYKLIPAWEEETGATVEFVFKGNGFETDKRLVQDFATGTVDYDVSWDHSSFFSQYVKADGLEGRISVWG
jgi:multiple sugar transport system substrate-binding protein